MNELIVQLKYAPINTLITCVFCAIASWLLIKYVCATKIETNDVGNKMLLKIEEIHTKLEKYVTWKDAEKHQKKMVDSFEKSVVMQINNSEKLVTTQINSVKELFEAKLKTNGNILNHQNSSSQPLM